MSSVAGQGDHAGLGDDGDGKDDHDIGAGGGFKTAAGKKVHVSKEALAKAKRDWHQMQEEQEQDLPEGEPLFKKAKGETSQRQSWRPPASNSSKGGLTVSAEALKLARDKWKQVRDSPDFSLSSRSQSQSQSQEMEVDTKPQPLEVDMGGFCTASGKKVLVSEEALAKARQDWNDTEKEDFTSSSQHGQSRSSDKNVFRVSQEALSRASQAWESTRETVTNQSEASSTTFRNDAQEQNKDDDDDVRLEARRRPAGFSTGSGKTVSISADALDKARQLWQQMEEASGAATGTPTAKVESPLVQAATPPLRSGGGRRIGLSRLSGNSSTTPILRSSASGASPAFRSHTAKPRLAFKAPSRIEKKKAEATTEAMGTSVESQEFEAEVFGWMEKADL